MTRQCRPKQKCQPKKCYNIKSLTRSQFLHPIAAPGLSYNSTEIIVENRLFSNLTHAFIMANSAAIPYIGADR